MQIRTTFVVIFLIRFSCVLRAQTLDPDYALKRAVYDGERYVQFHIMDPDARVGKLDSDKFYTWTKSQKIQTTQGGASGDLLNGQYSSFYKNNQLEEQGSYKRGLKNGKWTTWNQEGRIIAISKYRNGKKTGEERIYDDAGSLLFTRKYHGKTVRTEKEDSVIIKKKEQSVVYVYGEGGTKEQVIRRKNDVLHGKQFERLTDSSFYLSKYRNGEQVKEKEKVEKHPVKDFWRKIKPVKKEKAAKEEKLTRQKKEKAEKPARPEKEKEKMPKEKKKKDADEKK